MADIKGPKSRNIEDRRHDHAGTKWLREKVDQLTPRPPAPVPYAPLMPPDADEMKQILDEGEPRYYRKFAKGGKVMNHKSWRK